MSSWRCAAPGSPSPPPSRSGTSPGKANCMITVLVANPKGGCGKTTIATHLAAAFAAAGLRAGLADADRQGSSLGWLERSEEHTSELQSLMRISYAVFCLKKKKHKTIMRHYHKYQNL